MTLKSFSDRLREEAGNKNLWSTRIGITALSLVVVSVLAVLAWLYWYTYRPDQQVDAEAARAAIEAANEGTVAILSYSPDTLDRDFSTARSYLTGEFLASYDRSTQQIVGPTAKQKAVKTSAVVLRSALSELHPESATVLVFVSQSTQSEDSPAPTMANSTVLVKLTKADEKWLISQFDQA